MEQMKRPPWEETWHLEGGRIVVGEKPDSAHDGFFGEVSASGSSCPSVSLDSLEEDAARMGLAATSPELYRLVAWLVETHGRAIKEEGWWTKAESALAKAKAYR